MNILPTNQDDLLKFMKSLADARRLKIAGLLGVEALTPSQVAERLGMESAEVEQHLEQLAAAGLAHREGSVYRLDSQALEKLTRQGLLEWAGEKLRLTQRGRLLGNRVFVEFI